MTILYYNSRYLLQPHEQRHKYLKPIKKDNWKQTMRFDDDGSKSMKPCEGPSAQIFKMSIIKTKKEAKWWAGPSITKHACSPSMAFFGLKKGGLLHTTMLSSICFLLYNQILIISKSTILPSTSRLIK